MKEAELLKEYRESHPKSRAQGILVLAVNTSSRKQQKCILCGAVGPTWSSEWPMTVRASSWGLDHIRSHES